MIASQSQIEHRLAQLFGQRHLDDFELRAGKLLPGRAQTVQWSRNSTLRTAVVDRDRNLLAFVRLFALTKITAELFLAEMNDFLVFEGNQIDPSVTVPF